MEDSQELHMTKNIGTLQSPADHNVNTLTEELTQVTKTNKANTCKSTRPKKETKHYGDTSNLDFLDSSDDDDPPHKRHTASVASYSPPKSTTKDTPASPARSTIPVASTSYRNIDMVQPPQSQDEQHTDYPDITDVGQGEDDSARYLQPHEF